MSGLRESRAVNDHSIAVRAFTVPAPLVQVAAMAAVAVAAGIAVAGTAAPATSAVAGAVVAMAWFGSAFGLGRLARFALFPAIGRDHPAHAGLTLGLGVAVLLWVDVTLGSLGAFGGAGGWRQVLAWATLVPGLLLLGDPRRTAAGDMTSLRALASLPLAWCALPALAVLAFATSLPPGVAWATEFGGYDALSYHLELPRTWFEMRRIATVPDSVYSAFPNFVEAAFLHCMSLIGQAAPHGLAMAPQVLHALLGVGAAVAVGGVAAMLAGPDPHRARVAQAAGFVALLGVPWVIVTGSLAYDEMAVLLMAATALLAWGARMEGHEDRRDAPAATVGIAVGLALGAAIGAKLTAVGMVALPFAAWAIVGGTAGGARALARSAGWATVAAGAMLVPWLIRNAADSGSALFPFSASGLGWTPEQFARFAAGHAAPPGTGLDARLTALWDHAFREGLGPAPDADPWLPQWGVAFWAGMLALAVLARHTPRAALALAAMLAAQLAFWMFATHLKARFLLPCAVPLCAAMGAALAPAALAGATRGARWAAGAAAAAMLCAWSLQPAWVLSTDPRMNDPRGIVANLPAIGDAIASLGPGTAADAKALADQGAPLPLAWFANWRLPPGAVLGCEGEADVFWCIDAPRWGTVWNGGPLAQALRAHPDDPGAAVAALRAAGITHLAVGEATLARWERAGWLDPVLTPERIRAVTSRLKPVARTTSGGTIYEIPAP
jgi:hypothetical protein